MTPGLIATVLIIAALCVVAVLSGRYGWAEKVMDFIAGEKK